MRTFKTRTYEVDEYDMNMILESLEYYRDMAGDGTAISRDDVEALIEKLDQELNK